MTLGTMAASVSVVAPNLLSVDQATLETSAAGWQATAGAAAQSTVRAREGTHSLAVTGGQLRNLLPNDDLASIEGGVSTWGAESNTTIARVTTGADAGAAALQMTRTNTAGAPAANTTTGLALGIVAGQTYTLHGSFLTQVAGRTATLQVRFYDAGDVQVGGETLRANIPLTPGVWTRGRHVVAAPTGAVKARLRVFLNTAAIGELLLCDRFGIVVGDVPLDWWSLPSQGQTARPATNLLVGPNLADAEVGTTDGWGLAANGTLASSSVRAAHGDRSILYTHTVASAPAVLLTLAPGAPSTTYTMIASIWTAAAGKTAGVGYRTFTAGNVLIDNYTWGPSQPLVAGQWNQLRFVFTTNPTATIAFLQPLVGPAGGIGEGYWIDRVGLFAGDVPASAWDVPGQPGAGITTSGSALGALPVAPHTLMASVWPPWATRVLARFSWTDAVGAALGETLVAFDVPAGVWTDVVAHVVSPVGAAGCRPGIVWPELGPGVTGWVDQLGYWRSRVDEWAAP